MIYLIAIHLIIFQAMFFIKNIVTSKKIGATVKGKNREANLSISLFITTYTILFATVIFKPTHFLMSPLLEFTTPLFIVGVSLLSISLLVAATSLIEMRESWRVGIKESDQIELVTTGIYRYTRNPYFLSYFLHFAGYVILVPTPLIVTVVTLSIFTVHRMVIKEESYLTKTLGDSYLSYKDSVSRYIGLYRK
jgi:protein-S-isoprenylcysteine O-methyltransferase Ste14